MDRLNEKVLRKIIAKNAKKALKEFRLPAVPSTDYDGNDLNYDNVFYQALKVVDEMMNDGINEIRWQDVAKRMGYHLETLNEADMELLHDAIEDAMATPGIDDMNESKTNKNMKKNVVKINENTLRQIVAESVKKVLKESAMRGLDDIGVPTHYATQDDEKIDYAMEQCAKAAMEFVMDKTSQLSEQWFKEFCERCANDGLFNTLDERQIKQCYIKGNKAAHSCVYKGNGVQYGRIPTHYNGEWQD